MALRVAAETNLLAAWEHLRDRANERAWWSREFELFGEQVARELVVLSDELRDELWQPGELRVVRIPKRKGGERVLHVPTVRDRVAERAVSQVLAADVDGLLSPWAFGFRRGLSTDDALLRLARERDEGATHVLRVDLRDCFGSIDREWMARRLRETCRDPWLHAVVDAVLHRRLRGLENDLEGIAQGSPLSPVLVNLALDDLDRALTRAGVPAVRYVDDLAVPVRGASSGAEVARRVRQTVRTFGLSLNHDKESVMSFDDGVAYLGGEVGATYPLSDPGAVEPPPRRRSLYLTPAVRNVFMRKGQVRAVDSAGEQVMAVPISALARMVMIGPVGLSAGLRSYALQHDLDVSFLSRNGGWLGRLDGHHPVDPDLRARQYELATSEKQADVAREILRAKILTQRALLQRYARRPRLASIVKVVDGLAVSVERLDNAETLPSMLGLEGTAARAYFRGLSDLLPEQWRFASRNRRPPRDPANALLSFGYALLQAEAHGAVAGLGFDPHVGFVHRRTGRMPSLALDLMEEFRPLVVDTTVLSLLRRRRLKARDFHRRESGAVRLTDRGRRRFVEAYEERMLTRFGHRRTGRRVTYRHALLLQARELRRLVEVPQAQFAALGWR